MIKKAGSAKAGPAGASAAREKAALPSRAEILAFISREQANSPAKIGKREIARAFSVTGADRIGLKKILKELEAEGAIARWRDAMGATDPAKAAPGTIRKDLGTSIQNNCTHGSDAPETAAFEIGYFFAGMELI